MDKNLKLVYFGNLPVVAETLATLPGVALRAWAVEQQDDCDLLRKIAQQYQIPLVALKNKQQIEMLLNEQLFDLALLGNFGWIVSVAALAKTDRGFMNLHLGLLPENPGRYPIQKAIKDNHPFTGVTLHWVTQTPDTGPIIAKRTVPVSEQRYAEVFERLMRLIPDLLKNELPKMTA